jgi:hypothetical protein
MHWANLESSRRNLAPYLAARVLGGGGVALVAAGGGLADAVTVAETCFETALAEAV